MLEQVFTTLCSFVLLLFRSQQRVQMTLAQGSGKALLTSASGVGVDSTSEDVVPLSIIPNDWPVKIEYFLHS